MTANIRLGSEQKNDDKYGNVNLYWNNTPESST